VEPTGNVAIQPRIRIGIFGDTGPQVAAKLQALRTKRKAQRLTSTNPFMQLICMGEGLWLDLSAFVKDLIDMSYRKAHDEQQLEFLLFSPMSQMSKQASHRE
jgi:hypothetical protein